MGNAYLGLGSNRGDRQAYLDAAIDALCQLPDTALTGVSPVYETLPMGPQDQGLYFNMAAELDCTRDPDWLIDELQRIELELGRASREQRRHWGPREIDIDLLLYDDQVRTGSRLTLPHIGMHERWFVLKPLADIAPEAVHPVMGKTVIELLAKLEAAGASQGVAL
ncbi:MAG: 2-amino-4-hydroxy-6-hydroxymethyldihydropteridine diphosphokinase [Planctomycetota bacterium]